MLQMRCNVDRKHKQRLHDAMIKSRQVLANLVEFKLIEFKEIDALTKLIKNKTIYEPIMDLKSEGGDKLFIAIERLKNGDLVI